MPEVLARMAPPAPFSLPRIYGNEQQIFLPL
jgi:hypothetical protein